MTARVHSGDEIWAEWEFKSESAKDDHRTVLAARRHRRGGGRGLTGPARFYMEPVEAADS